MVCSTTRIQIKGKLNLNTKKSSLSDFIRKHTVYKCRFAALRHRHVDKAQKFRNAPLRSKRRCKSCHQRVFTMHGKDHVCVLIKFPLQISGTQLCNFILSRSLHNGRRKAGLLRGGERPVASCFEGGRRAGGGQAASRPQVKNKARQCFHDLAFQFAAGWQPGIHSPAKSGISCFAT